MTSANECTSLLHPSVTFSTEISCSKVNDSICYSITRTSSGNTHTTVNKIDFGSLAAFSYLDVQSDNYVVTSVAAVDNQEVIGAGFQNPTTMDYTFFRFNFNDDNFTWAVTSTAISK